MNINVTKPFLPPYEEYLAHLEKIWNRGWLTNNGPLVNELELKLKEFLGVEHLLYVNSGTIALQIAIKALDLHGDVLTTPFSYVATTSTLCWEGCRPVMVDISPDTLNIDPARIEAAITPRTTGIVATHVFGNACDVDAIDAIAKKHNLAVIYDAAHAFGATYKGRSLLACGDVAATSFHATKLFHTVEGGALVTPDADKLRRMALMRNFGHVSPTEFAEVGINGKSSEFHAAMGLCIIGRVPEIIERRKLLSEHYRAQLANTSLRTQTLNPDCGYNYAYYPVIFEDETQLLDAISVLNAHSVFPRRYFYPSLSSLPYVEGQSTPVADSIAKRILCLPLFHSLSQEEIDMICRLVKRAIRYGS